MSAPGSGHAGSGRGKSSIMAHHGGVRKEQPWPQGIVTPPVASRPGNPTRERGTRLVDASAQCKTNVFLAPPPSLTRRAIRERPQPRVPQKKRLTLYGTRRRIDTDTASVVNSKECSVMSRELPSLGELEIRALRLVWEHQPCTERQVSEIIQ